MDTTYSSNTNHPRIMEACKKLWEQESPKIDEDSDSTFEYFCACLKHLSEPPCDMHISMKHLCIAVACKNMSEQDCSQDFSQIDKDSMKHLAKYHKDLFQKFSSNKDSHMLCKKYFDNDL